MRLKQKTLLCAALLLAAALLGMQTSHLHFTPRAAFEDACLGRYGYIPTSVGTFRSDRAQYIFTQEAGQPGVWVADRAGPLWFLHDQRDIRLTSEPFCPTCIFDRADSTSVAAFRMEPDIDRLLLTVTLPDGREQELPAPTQYEDIFFWYLPDTLSGQELNDIQEQGFTSHFRAYDEQRILLYELDY